ncbi:MAG: DsbA family protein, partial [Alphaproteobacteria bacterium]
VVAMAAAEFVPYLDLHRAAMTSSGRVSGSSMLTLAVELGADLEQLQARIAEEQESILSSLNNTQTAARALGVSGTPAFFIEDTLIPGAVGQGELSEVIADIRAARN